MPSVRREIRIDAPRQAVWDTLADIGAVSEWNPIVTHSVETTAEAGDTGIGSARHCDLPGAMGAVDEVVTGWDEPRSMQYEVNGARMMRSMTARFELAEEQTATHVTLTSDFSMSLGPIGALMAATVGRQMMGRQLARTLEGLKAHVEAQPESSDAASTERSQVSPSGQ